MDANELLIEVINFLNEKRLYDNFLSWAENMGFDSSEIDSDIEKAVN